MYLAYAVETTAGTRPTAGYKIIPEIKSMPSLNEAPNTVDTTTLLDTEYESSAAGLKTNSVKEYGANLTDEVVDFWEQLLTDYETGLKEGKAMWFATIHRYLTKATFYKGEPSPINFNDSAPNGALETTMYITPNGKVEWGDKPTFASDSVVSTI
jgi:hypothetical protein